MSSWPGSWSGPHLAPWAITTAYPPAGHGLPRHVLLRRRLLQLPELRPAGGRRCVPVHQQGDPRRSRPRPGQPRVVAGGSAESAPGRGTPAPGLPPLRRRRRRWASSSSRPVARESWAWARPIACPRSCSSPAAAAVSEALALRVRGSGPTDCLDLFTGLLPLRRLPDQSPLHGRNGLAPPGPAPLRHRPTDGRGLRPRGPGGDRLALVRPYDFVLLVLVRGMAVLVARARPALAGAWLPLARAAPGGGLPLLALLPRTRPSPSTRARRTSSLPSRTSCGPSVPRCSSPLGGRLRRAADESSRRARVHLALWAGLALLVIVARPVSFSLQFLVGLGFPLLALGALGLAAASSPPSPCWPRSPSPSTFGVALHFMLTPAPTGSPGRDTMALVETLRGPPAGRATSCSLLPTSGSSPMASPPAAPSCRTASARATTSESRSSSASARCGPRDRRALLDRYNVRHLVLPGDAGPTAAIWLGEEAGWTQVGVVRQPRALELVHAALGAVARQ